MLKVCFVHADAYPVLSGTSDTTYLGGESVQHSLLAKAFSAAGHDVSAIVRDFGQQDGETIGRIRVYKTCAPTAGLPVVRFVHPKTTSLWSALKRANADIYYFSCADYVPAVLAAFARRYDRRFVFRVAHDSDCVPSEHMLRFRRDKILYAYGLRRANAILAQTVKQQALLRQHYGLSSEVVDMVVEDPAENLDGPRDIDVLWVNNMRSFKRPELLVEVAQRCPGLRFVMIGGPVPGQESYYEGILRAARGVSNLEALGPVPYKDVNAYFARAKLFVNTSESEGFPNSFLQAWIRGVPIVSFFDPDGLIERRGFGMRVADIEQMAAALSALAGDPTRLAAMAALVRRYAVDTYSAAAVTKRYVELFERL